MPKRPLRPVIFALAVALFGGAATAYQRGGELPQLNATHDNIITREREQRLGDIFYKQLHQSGAMLSDIEANQYLQNLGDRLRAGTGAGTNFHFFILRDANINAFATFGGYIGVNVGLILATQSEDELAGVLAHEMAHITQRHHARMFERANKSAWAQVGALLGAIALAANGDAQGASALVLASTAAHYQSLITYTREHEQEADRTGIAYMAAAGYNPNGMAGFFEKLQAQNLQDDMRFEFLRTHPLTVNRIAEAKERAAQLTQESQRLAKFRPSSQPYEWTKARLRATSANARSMLAGFDKRIGKKNDLTQLTALENYSRAWLLYQNGDYAKARAALEYLLKQHPEQKTLQILLAQVDFADKKTAAARARLETLRRIYPDDVVILSAYSQILLAEKQAKPLLEALSAYRHKLPPELVRSQASAHNLLGQKLAAELLMADYFYQIGDYHAANLQLSAAKKHQPNAAQLNQIKVLQQQINAERRELEKLS